MFATASALHTRFEYRPGKRNSDHGNHQLHRRWILTIHVHSQFFCVKWLGLHRPRPPSSVLAWPVPSGASRHQVSKPPPPKTIIVPPPGGLYVPIELPYGVGILLLFRWDSPKLKPRFPLCGVFSLVTTTEPCARAAARAWSSHRQSPPSLIPRNDLAPCSQQIARVFLHGMFSSLGDGASAPEARATVPSPPPAAARTSFAISCAIPPGSILTKGVLVGGGGFPGGELQVTFCPGGGQNPAPRRPALFCAKREA
jgi:hypothetical protein